MTIHLINLKGERYEKLDDIIKYLSELGCKIEEVKVDYEFQTNANTMLKIKKMKNLKLTFGCFDISLQSNNNLSKQKL